MKMKQEDYWYLREAIRPYHSQDLKKQYEMAGLSNKRYRWDLVHRSGFNVCPFYTYLNDDHIDTALRHITNTSK